ncbi:hypothetical protein [Amycolatopsis rifamycinica]|uniref:Uncharacterized protein n=1 Tax=Amycolatopsis rifamycinica TaxID=287986 RepID=A0A066UCW0_9PSEU|nr:hypothetical protein [Amycolatopsis rifamycinica]KDN22068.1 hypothetical protein DV20_11835 [Amycolatopsis rifamycinica]
MTKTAVELADDAFAAPDPGYGARLAAIRAAAAADGVSVVVDLHGALVDLRFDRWALNRPSGELAGLIRRLAAEAGADALRQGGDLLGELLGGLLPDGLEPMARSGGELLGGLLPDEPQPAARSARPRRPPEPDETEPVARSGRELLGGLLPDEPQPAARSARPRRPPEPDEASLVPATWAT